MIKNREKYTKYLPYNYLPLTVAFLVLIFLPVFVGDFLLFVIKLSLIFSIFALAYDLFFGYTGMVSFGHSIFYGIGAYSMAIIAVQLGITNPILLLIIAFISGTVIGLISGYISTFTEGIYLALVTFALAHLSWLVINSDPYGLTNGENGIPVSTSVFNLGGIKMNLGEGIGLYYLILILFIVTYLSLKVLVNSPFGDVLQGIKNNEERIESLGYNARRYKIVSFTISGAFSGIAGCLAGFLQFFVTPGFVHWSIGAEAILWTILGGTGTLVGPILGAFTLTILRSYLESIIGGIWIFIYGGLFIAVVMFLSGGLISIIENIKERLKEILE